MQTAQAAERLPGQRLLVGAACAVAPEPLIDRLANPGARQPGVITYLGVGLAVVMLTAVLLFAGLREVLPRSGVFAAAFLSYNALLITVKFVVAPVSLYRIAGDQGLSVLGSDAGGFGYIGFPLVTAMTAAAYGTAFFLLSLYYRSRLRTHLGIPVRFETGFVGLYLAMFLLGVAAAISLGWLAGLDYLVALLYASALALLLAFALVGALVLCGVAFNEATVQAALLRNVTLFSSFTWIGLAFIAAYHVLWLVFVLVIITIWPLKSLSVK